MTVEERFERLEKESNHLKQWMKRWRAATTGLAGIVVSLVICGAVDNAPTDLKVKSLEVVDETGFTTIRIGTQPQDKGNPGLKITKNPLKGWISTVSVGFNGDDDPYLNLFNLSLTMRFMPRLA